MVECGMGMSEPTLELGNQLFAFKEASESIIYNFLH